MKTKDFILHGTLNDPDGTEVEIHVCELNDFIHAKDDSIIFYMYHGGQSSCLKREITFTDAEY